MVQGIWKFCKPLNKVEGMLPPIYQVHTSHHRAGLDVAVCPSQSHTGVLPDHKIYLGIERQLILLVKDTINLYQTKRVTLENNIFAQDGHWLCSGGLPTPWTSACRPGSVRSQRKRQRATSEAPVRSVEREARGIKCTLECGDKDAQRICGEGAHELNFKTFCKLSKNKDWAW